MLTIVFLEVSFVQYLFVSHWKQSFGLFLNKARKKMNYGRLKQKQNTFWIVFQYSFQLPCLPGLSN